MLANLAPGKRIGLLGGTFDPVHKGHLAMADAVLKKLELDYVVFIPAFCPPHKINYTVSPFAARLKMLKLAVNENRSFFSSNIEAKRAGPSYTFDTLVDVRNQLNFTQKLFFIIGLDAFVEIHTWNNFNDLLGYTNFAIIGRPPYSLKYLGHYIKKTFPAYNYDFARKLWEHHLCSSLGRIHLVEMIPIQISSTLIRQKVAKRESVSSLIIPEVAQYIEENSLYDAWNGIFDLSNKEY